MLEPTLIHSDDDLIILDKPSGLLVHGTGRGEEETLVDWLCVKFPGVANVGDDPELRPGIVHRLDRDTSGIMVVARSSAAYESLKKQFAEREIQKTYRAFVYGIVKEERGNIDRGLGRSPGSGSRRSVKDPHGIVRQAQTTYRTLARGGVGEESASYLDVFPKSGRTHQIRVHLSFIGHPVICDELYAPRRPGLLGFSRLALHAYSLTLRHPHTGKTISYSAPLPGDFLRAEERLRAES